MSDNGLLTAAEAARLVGVSKRSIHFAANRSKRLPAKWVAVAGHARPLLFIQLDDLLAWDEARPRWAKRLSQEAQARHKERETANAQ